MLKFVVVQLVTLILAACSNTALPTPDPQAPRPFPTAQPGLDWTRVTAQGFSLALPPEWTLRERQGVDSYVGEVGGDGMRLEWDFGKYSWDLNPEDEWKHKYTVSYEYIDGLTAKLLLSTDPNGNTTAEYEAATGVYFPNLRRGQEFNLIGRGLTLEQQRVAVAIFRGIRH